MKEKALHLGLARFERKGVPETLIKAGVYRTE